MLKRPQKKQPTRAKPDENQAAFAAAQRVIELTEGEAKPVDAATEQPADFRKQLSSYMSELGRKGGRVGGKMRLQTMTSDERAEVASKAAKARWAKRKKAT